MDMKSYSGTIYCFRLFFYQVKWRSYLETREIKMRINLFYHLVQLFFIWITRNKWVNSPLMKYLSGSLGLLRLQLSLLDLVPKWLFGKIIANRVGWRNWTPLKVKILIKYTFFFSLDLTGRLHYSDCTYQILANKRAHINM